jgi:hypothetical protein
MRFVAALVISLPVVVPGGCGQSRAEQKVAPGYHQIRLEFETTSDWSVLELSEQFDPITLNHRETNGNPTLAEVTTRRLVLNQELARARRDGRVSLVLDYAIPATDLSSLDYTVTKGAINASTVKFSIVLDSNVVWPLHSFVHKGTRKEDVAVNTVRERADLSLLRYIIPRSAIPGKRITNRKLWAFYYPWYRKDAWQFSTPEQPAGIRYGSDDETVIRTHIHEAKKAGIDGFVVSWSGPRDFVDRNLKKILAIADEEKFSICLYVETLTKDGPLKPEKLREWFSYAMSSYREHPAYEKVEGKPVFVIWASRETPLSVWQTVFSDVKKKGMDGVYIGMSYDLPDLAVFDGLHQYGVFTLKDVKKTVRETARGVRFYPLLAKSPEPKIFAATVQPGYDERILPGRKGLFQDRHNGDFYRMTFEAAIAADPDWIFITSWNEWFENTQIEAGRSYGDLYLRLTGEYAARWKSAREQ